MPKSALSPTRHTKLLKCRDKHSPYRLSPLRCLRWLFDWPDQERMAFSKPFTMSTAYSSSPFSLISSNSSDKIVRALFAVKNPVISKQIKFASLLLSNRNVFTSSSSSCSSGRYEPVNAKPNESIRVFSGEQANESSSTSASFLFTFPLAFSSTSLSSSPGLSITGIGNWSSSNLRTFGPHWCTRISRKLCSSKNSSFSNCWYLSKSKNRTIDSGEQPLSGYGRHLIIRSSFRPQFFRAVYVRW